MLICSNSHLLVNHLVFRILVPFRRDIIKRKDLFFYSGTDSFKTRNMDKLSVDYYIYLDNYAADAIGMTRCGLLVIGALSRHQNCTN